MDKFSSSDPIGKIEGPSKKEDKEGDFLEQGPDKLKGEDNPSLTRPVFTGKQGVPEKEEKDKKEPPLKFKGSFGGGTIRTKLFSFVMGRKSGRKDFKAFRVKKDVLEGMKELREGFSKGGGYIRRSTAQIEATKLWRKLPHLKGDEHTAAVKFLEELKNKTGVEPRK